MAATGLASSQPSCRSTDMGGKKGRSGRKPLFGKAMTDAERQKRRYDRFAAPRREAWRQLWERFERIMPKTKPERPGLS